MKISNLPSASAGNSPPRLSSPTPAKPMSDHDRAVASAKAVAANRVKKIIERQKLVPFKSWDEVAEFSGIAITAATRELPLTFAALYTFTMAYVRDTEKRMAEAQLAAQTATTEGIVLKSDLLPFNLKSPPFRPILRQRRAYSQIWRELYSPNSPHRAVVIPMPTGSGKTSVAASVVLELQRNHYFGNLGAGMFNVIYLTPKRVQIKTRRALIAAGIKDVVAEVQCVTYNQLSSAVFKSNFAETTVDSFGEKRKVFRWKFKSMHPQLIIVDECHRIKKRDTQVSRLVQAFLEFPDTRWLFMSATPFVCPNDMMVFAVASRKQYSGQSITPDNWREFAWTIGGADPTKPNSAAMERLKDWFGDLVVNPPADPRKVKSYNKVITIPFPDEETRQRYLKAEDDWLEKCERLGKIPSEQGQIMAQTTIFRAASERLMAPSLAALALKDYAAGFAPVIGLAFTDGVKRIVDTWVQAGIPRNKISLIWGGSQIIREDQCYPLLEWVHMQKIIEENDGDMSHLSRAEIAKYRRTARFLAERWGSGDSIEQQRDRNDRLVKLLMTPQSAEMQQIEVDKFQAGASDFCIFTLSAGSVGIDLDHQHDQTRPRRAKFSPTFYAEEVIQAFGRCCRESTISDVEQSIIYFDNTIMSRIVAPKLAKKISSVNSIAKTGLDLEADMIAAAVSGKARALAAAVQPIIENSAPTSEVPDDELGDLESEAEDEELEAVK